MTPKNRISFMDGPYCNNGTELQTWSKHYRNNVMISNHSIKPVELYEFFTKGPSINDIRFFGVIFDPPSPLSPIFLLYKGFFT